MDLISVIIPVYNTEKYLTRCLDSVLGNTYENLEVICINDGSTDDSGRILAEYAEKDSRIIVINQENAGVSAARNAGLDAAKGEYIAFVDSDDWVHKQYFELMISAQKERSSDIVACDLQNVYGSAQTTNTPFIPSSNGTVLLLENILQGGGHLKHAVLAKLYRKETIDCTRFDPFLTWGEDTSFNFSLYSRSKEISVTSISHQLYFYFHQAASISHSIPLEKKLPLNQWYISQAHTITCPSAKKLFLEQACKEALANRYVASIQKSKKDQFLCKEKILQCKGLVRNSGLLPKKRVLLYELLFFMPIAYRIFRIINDPTILYWEKQQRKLRGTDEKNPLPHP